MKKIFRFVSVLISLSGSFAFGQNYVNPNAEELLSQVNSISTNDKVIKLMCTTLSCCGIGSWGVDIWSDKECHYIVTNKSSNNNIVVINVENNLVSKASNDVKGVKVENDQILYDPNKTLGDDQAYAMKAGEYKVINGQIAFEPTIISARSVCWVETHQGHIFGHEYSYSYAFCIKVPFTKNVYTSSGGILTVNLSQNQELLALAKKNNDFLSFDEDIVLNNDITEAKKTGEKIVVKAGKYKINEDGIIYIRNFSTIKN